MTMDADEIALLTDSLRATMTGSTGDALDHALLDFGWLDLLTETPEVAIPLVFRLLGETGAHAPVLNDVIARAAGRDLPATVALPFTGGRWMMWERTVVAPSSPAATPVTAADPGPDPTGRAAPGPGGIQPDAVDPADRSTADARLDADGVSGGTDPTASQSFSAAPGLDPELPLRRVPAGETLPLAEGRRALAWWLAGTSRAMLNLARRHALDRVQFGRPLAAHQAVRHRLAETLVAIEGAEATLTTADTDLGALLAKAAAGHAARIAARHCQQVLGGIGFTAEHDFHRHARRALVLDGLLGSAAELTREAGAWVRTRAAAPRLAQL
ncbi:Acyl-CoA dehydrogenase, short-chain specific [Nocardia cerradoensis]|uniref:Acyl-CoA dehydrogenase, short-chain specific n=1 Tax=Nocardia cerradoensis TaxID=85688 RepID=A0A231HA71_9NOCA|nr:acyl-CoA dehydrogenase family protein [Nocardia cerradoensis]OXR45712.1 Acyl-CoA dehydrogenase, short-chain specific [Nocardia cerradoensis]